MHAYQAPLPGGTTLALFQGPDKRIWTSSGRWLHPLFDLEGFLRDHPGDKGELRLHDTIQGRAAAALCVHLGIRHVAVDLISDLALDLYHREGVTDIFYLKKTGKIKCCTEDLTTSSMPIADIYMFLRKKANLTGGLELEVRDASFSYPGKDVFSSVSFILGKGDACILEGENGSGKSTLISCILGLLPLRSGEVLFDGDKRMHDTAYVKQSQNVSPFPLSVYEVVRMAVSKKEDAEEAVELALRRTGVYHLKDRNYFTLSGGEAQKVNLARALAGKARLFLLDEPTASLDKESKESFVSLLSSLRFSEMPTILLVSHDQSVNDALAWKRLRLEGGCLV